jgi:hypothetical protein
VKILVGKRVIGWKGDKASNDDTPKGLFSAEHRWLGNRFIEQMRWAAVMRGFPAHASNAWCSQLRVIPSFYKPSIGLALSLGVYFTHDSTVSLYATYWNVHDIPWSHN